MLEKLFHAHTAIAIVFGLLLLWKPELLPFTEGNQGAVHVAKLYGIVVFILGLISYQMRGSTVDPEAMRKIYLSVITMYMMTGLYFIALYRSGTVSHPLVGSLCLVFAGLVVISYMNEIVGKRK